MYIEGGNSLQSIYEAYRIGADLLDVDANYVDGSVWVEHGIIPEVKMTLGGRVVGSHFPAVVDVNEKEVRLGMPNTFEEIISYVASLSTPERPLAVSIELKRGEFDLNTLNSMVDTLKVYNVNAIIYSTKPEQLNPIGNEIRQSLITIPASN